ncbi:MAG TPA: TnsA-like heteromeric transposase endonuclease subunit [Nocardioides sp.]|nr:TnsA-like heteromeric transposase endonuclease subunit [Nocardioides sp.]
MRTVGSHLMLESGLEHDLVRVLDRDPDVTWIVPQPLQLEWGAGRNRKHVPDLLAAGPNGSVTVWDVKTATATASARFDIARQLTEQACASVGWKYAVFTGLPAVHRHNLLWLHAYRSRPAWADRWEGELLAAASDGTTLGELVGCEPGRTSLTWHLIWAGRLSVDLTRPLTSTTRVAS